MPGLTAYSLSSAAGQGLDNVCSPHQMWRPEDYPLLGDMYPATHRLTPAPSLCVQHGLVPSWAKPGAQCWNTVSILVRALALSLVQCRASAQEGALLHLHPRPRPAQPLPQGLARSSTHSAGGWGTAGLRPGFISAGTLWRQLDQLLAVTRGGLLWGLQVQELDRDPRPQPRQGGQAKGGKGPWVGYSEP